jgi:hypothetical protein
VPGAGDGLGRAQELELDHSTVMDASAVPAI